MALARRVSEFETRLRPRLGTRVVVDAVGGVGVAGRVGSTSEVRRCLAGRPFTLRVFCLLRTGLRTESLHHSSYNKSEVPRRMETEIDVRVLHSFMGIIQLKTTNKPSRPRQRT